MSHPSRLVLVWATIRTTRCFGCASNIESLVRLDMMYNESLHPISVSCLFVAVKPLNRSHYC